MPGWRLFYRDFSKISGNRFDILSALFLDKTLYRLAERKACGKIVEPGTFAGAIDGYGIDCQHIHGFGD